MWGRLAIASLACGCSFQHGGVSRDDGGPQADGRPVDGSLATGDAMPPDDAKVFMDAAVLLCPATYTISDAARPNSTYRLVTASTTWAGAELDCENDGGGAFAPGHLIVLDNDAERLWAFQQHNSDQWVGATDILSEQSWQAWRTSWPTTQSPTPD